MSSETGHGEEAVRQAIAPLVGAPSAEAFRCYVIITTDAQGIPRYWASNLARRTDIPLVLGLAAEILQRVGE